MGQSPNYTDLIKQKKAERIVDVMLNRMNDYAEEGITEDLHPEMVSIVQRILSPEFEEYRDDFESSNISTIAYDEKSAVLQVDFNTGARYQYFGVELSLAEKLLDAESKGKVLASAIKPHCPCMRVS